MDFMDESVDELYSSAEMLEVMEAMDEAAEYEPQEYGLQEATLFDF